MHHSIKNKVTKLQPPISLRIMCTFARSIHICLLMDSIPMVKLEKLSKEKNKVKNTREYEKKREIRE